MRSLFSPPASKCFSPTRALRMSPSVARPASREGQRAQVPAAFSAPKRKLPARSAGRKPRFPSSRRKAGPSIAVNVFSSGARWVRPLSPAERESPDTRNVLDAGRMLRPGPKRQLYPIPSGSQMTSGPSIIPDRRAAVFCVLPLLVRLLCLRAQSAAKPLQTSAFRPACPWKRAANFPSS